MRRTGRAIRRRPALAPARSPAAATTSAALTAAGVLTVAAAMPAVGQDAEASAWRGGTLPEARSLIERHLEAVGGRKAVLAPASSRATGSFSIPGTGLEGSLEILSADPDRLLLRIEIPGLGGVRSGYDGEVGWSIDPASGPRVLEGAELAAMRDQATELAAVRDPSLIESARTVERTAVEGRECFKVELRWKSGRTTYDCYAPEDGLLVATMSTQESPMGRIEVVTTLDEYRSFGHGRVATRIVQSGMGVRQSLRIDTLEYGSVAPSEFAPPEAIRALLEKR